MDLPYNDLIHNLLLFTGCASEIDSGGLDAFVSHEVGKK